MIRMKHLEENNLIYAQNNLHMFLLKILKNHNLSDRNCNVQLQDGKC